ncbi:SUKH-3 domain-containing protein [Hymenobacter properus]|uniref:SUKH-3 domain-containing protein n=1 Tax=Hymenobacter properus TaxID=2791026 RepID=A0A931FJ66_9BACT|nr:SUKH-3 domain-containing protein [Hymenobacter properus]MBF9142692.1 SUKH-3 domain-containing protein [Hymenobacter properus]MBR7721500.1 SUKH-3 domain-containing protein [Microvirga sp. SRT04]
MYNFSPSTLAYLTQAGWEVGRKEWTIKYRAFLSGEGYDWFPAVADFLAEFGDLLIRFKREDGSSDTIDLDACNASSGFDSRWVTEDYTRRIGQTKFCAIGQAYSNHMLLFMDEAGRVYGGFDDFLCFIGNSGAEAIEVISSNQRERIKEIPE